MDEYAIKILIKIVGKVEASRTVPKIVHKIATLALLARPTTSTSLRSNSWLVVLLPELHILTYQYCSLALCTHIYRPCAYELSPELSPVVLIEWTNVLMFCSSSPLMN